MTDNCIVCGREAHCIWNKSDKFFRKGLICVVTYRYEWAQNWALEMVVLHDSGLVVKNKCNEIKFPPSTQVKNVGTWIMLVSSSAAANISATLCCRFILEDPKQSLFSPQMSHVFLNCVYRFIGLIEWIRWKKYYWADDRQCSRTFPKNWRCW